MASNHKTALFIYTDKWDFRKQYRSHRRWMFDYYEMMNYLHELGIDDFDYVEDRYFTMRTASQIIKNMSEHGVSVVLIDNIMRFRSITECDIFLNLCQALHIQVHFRFPKITIFDSEWNITPIYRCIQRKWDHYKFDEDEETEA